jgi:hypothetical protein
MRRSFRNRPSSLQFIGFMVLQRLRHPSRSKLFPCWFVTLCNAPLCISARNCRVRKDATPRLRHGIGIDEGKGGDDSLDFVESGGLVLMGKGEVCSANRNWGTRNARERSLNGEVVKSEEPGSFENRPNPKLSKCTALLGRPSIAKIGAPSKVYSKMTISGPALVHPRFYSSHTNPTPLKDATTTNRRTESLKSEPDERLNISKAEELIKPPGGPELSEQRNKMRLDIVRLNRIFKRYKKKINHLQISIAAFYEGTAVTRLKGQFLRIEKERMAPTFEEGGISGKKEGPGVGLQKNVIPKRRRRKEQYPLGRSLSGSTSENAAAKLNLVDDKHLRIRNWTPRRSFRKYLLDAEDKDLRIRYWASRPLFRKYVLDKAYEPINRLGTKPTKPHQLLERNKVPVRNRMDTREASSPAIESSRLRLMKTTQLRFMKTTRLRSEKVTTPIIAPIRSRTPFPRVKSFTSTTPAVDPTDRRGSVLVYVYSQILDSLMFNYGCCMASLAKSVETSYVERGRRKEDLVLLHHSKTMYERAADWQLGVKDYEPILWKRLKGANDDELAALTRLVRRQRVEM